MTLKKLLADAGWAESRGASAWLVGLTTFGILVLELALIRWTSGQVRVFAYVNNIILITAFLGLGVGVALGRRHPGLVHLVLPALLAVALPVAAAESLGLVHLTFPDQSITLWGAETINADLGTFVRNLAIFLGLLSGIGLVFVCAGAPLGHLFGRLPVLRAYTADLAGSLGGVLVFTLTAWLDAGPAVWLAWGVGPFVWLSRRWWVVPVAGAIIWLGYFSGQGATFSPYNRIVLIADPLFLQLEVNRDFHQYLHDVSAARLADPRLTTEDRSRLQNVRQLYDLPFAVNPRQGTALVVGAGTGNDVQAALRHGYRQVTSVDIDAQIIATGRRLHPEQPYSNPVVRTVVDDARSFFGKNRTEQYDVVCFGLLDSHAMVSAMSTLRLDNYVYTEEGIRAAWRRVAPGGHLSLAMACNAGQWFVDRLYWTIEKATGQTPIPVYNSMHGGTVTFLVPTNEAQFYRTVLEGRAMVGPQQTRAQTLTLTDDWPFLYIRPGVFPWGYVAVLGFVLMVAAATVRPVFGLGRAGAAFDTPLFLMGAAFLLIETRGVTSLSLLFGSTWVVNSAVFGGILVMVLLANLAVERWRWQNPVPWFLALFAAVVLLWFFPLDWLSTLPLFVRGAVGGLLTGLPVGLAGVIVPILLARSTQPAAALGSNLLGAVLGGCLEYYSMLGGLGSVALIALVLYLVAFLLVRRMPAAPAGA
jgi:SAM-dependent methyltransferase